MSPGHLPLSARADVVFQLETKLADFRHHADHIASLRHDPKFANDSIARLQQDIRQRDSELDGLAHRIVAREDEAEDFEYAALKQEHACVADEHHLALMEVTARAEGTQAELGAAV
jgi:hypothetical protein